MLLAHARFMQLTHGDSGSLSLPFLVAPTAHRSGPNPELVFGRPRFQVFQFPTCRVTLTRSLVFSESQFPPSVKWGQPGLPSRARCLAEPEGT